MGIKHFFRWFRDNFKECITDLKYGDSFSDEQINVPVDNLLLDMNGIFHSSAQRVFRYGEFTPLKNLLFTPKPTVKDDTRCFNNICKRIEELVYMVKPQKRIILCIDGPAPLSKQFQQRQRRFRSALEREKNSVVFDSNCITPGTSFMDHLSKYLDWFIRQKISWTGTKIPLKLSEI